jgi:hypothetical protein
VPLVDFIRDNLGVLTNSYEGERLAPGWDSLLEANDAHTYGDFALTNYCDPTADFGLGPAWEGLQRPIANDRDIVPSPILGATIGPEGSPFDPGKLGAYFQSSSQWAANDRHLLDLARESPSDVVADDVRMLERAVRAGKGLYITY